MHKDTLIATYREHPDAELFIVGSTSLDIWIQDMFKKENIKLKTVYHPYPASFAAEMSKTCTTCILCVDDHNDPIKCIKGLSMRVRIPLTTDDLLQL